MEIFNRFIERRSLAFAAFVFAVSALCATVITWQSEKVRIARERVAAHELADEHAHAIRLQVDQALSATYTLSALVKLGKGRFDEFEDTANQLLLLYPGASSLQLAPDGVIARVVPQAGNEKAIGHHLLTDPKRDKEAFLARDTGKLTLAGPFQLVQGGTGAAGRLPVFLDDGMGTERFWGFVIVLLRFPEILRTGHLTEMVDSGYEYELWRIHPDTGKKDVIAASSSMTLADPVERSLDVPNATWTLSVMPTHGWHDPAELALKGLFGLLTSLLLAFSTRYFIRD